MFLIAVVWTIARRFATSDVEDSPHGRFATHRLSLRVLLACNFGHHFRFKFFNIPMLIWKIRHTFSSFSTRGVRSLIFSTSTLLLPPVFQKLIPYPGMTPATCLHKIYFRLLLQFSCLTSVNNRVECKYKNTA